MDRRRRVTIVHKANVLKLGDGLFLSSARQFLAAEFPQIVVDDEHVDAMASLLVREPDRFDVVVTSNMFGGILSNLAAELGASVSTRKRCSLACRAASVALRVVMSTSKPPIWVIAPLPSWIGKRITMVQA